MILLLVIAILLILAAISYVKFGAETGSFDVSLLDSTGVLPQSWLPYGLLALALCLVALWFLGKLIGLPASIKRRAAMGDMKRSRQSLDTGMFQVATGEFETGESTLLSHLDGDGGGDNLALGDSAKLLTAARSAQARGASDRADSLLQMAAGSSTLSSVAVGVTRAEFLIDRGKHAEAGALLKNLHQSLPANQHISGLYAGVLKEQGQAGELTRLTDALREQGSVNSTELGDVEKSAWRASLQQAPADDIESRWKAAPADLKKDQEMIATYASRLADAGQPVEATKVLQKSIANNFNDELVGLYGSIDSGDSARQLKTAKRWQKSNEHSAPLLKSIAQLSMRNGQPAEARDSLAKSAQLDLNPDVCTELGVVLDSMNEPELASECYQNALRLSVGDSPVGLMADLPGLSSRLADTGKPAPDPQNTDDNGARKPRVVHRKISPGTEPKSKVVADPGATGQSQKTQGTAPAGEFDKTVVIGSGDDATGAASLPSPAPKEKLTERKPAERQPSKTTTASSTVKAGVAAVAATGAVAASKSASAGQSSGNATGVRSSEPASTTSGQGVNAAATSAVVTGVTPGIAARPASQPFAGKIPDQPPPFATSGPLLWMRENLFSSPANIVMTIVSLFLLYKIIPGAVNWAFFDATFVAADRNECRALNTGACWAFISKRLELFTFGFYPEAERWRVWLSFILLVIVVVGVLWEKCPLRKPIMWFGLLFPFVAGWLLLGGFGLKEVSTDQFGGFMLTLVIGVTGIAFSLPIGILLALGRQSNLPIIKYTCVGFIEFIRGVPLITLLFVASTMFSYFLPPGTTFDLLLRVLIMVTLFSAAYMAEVIRGGLQAIPKGQTEAADAMGLKYWPAMRLIVLPQALKISIPGIVNTFIGLYKDTTLVLVIGLLDPLGIGQASLADTKWQGLSNEVYLFVAIFFFVSCFAMARYSLNLENKLHRGHKN